jgi:hypothetical protein
VKRPPTDFELLRAIYERHVGDYSQRGPGDPKGVSYPIDIREIAVALGVSENAVFGRLYHHLDQVYGERPDEQGRRRFFFTPVAGAEVNCVNFPLLEAVLAGLWQEHRRRLLTVVLSLISLAIALAALIVSIVTA